MIINIIRKLFKSVYKILFFFSKINPFFKNVNKKQKNKKAC